MKRIQASVPKPMLKDIEDFKNRRGYQTDSEAIRELLRRGLP